MPGVVVVPYDPGWPAVFTVLRARLAPALEGIAVAIEHVGSTAVPGLAAKPVVDIDVIIPPGSASLGAAIEALARLGYEHRASRIQGREAFRQPDGLPSHHLYVCPEGSLGVRNHLILRDYLRSHPDDADAYASLKLDLANRFPDDIAAYAEYKTPFVLDLLRRAGMSASELMAIERQNGSDPTPNTA